MIDPKVQELILDFLVDEKAFWQKDSTYDTTKFVEPKLSDAHTRLYFEEADDQAKSLSELVPPSLPHPNRAGKTMILKGPAGAGKSFALCALALAAIERMEKALRDGEPPGWLPWRLDSADQLDDIVGQLEACCKNRSLVNDRDLVLQLIKTVPIVIMIDNLHEKVANHAKLPVLNRHFHWLLTARPGYALDIANAEIHALAGFGVAQRSALLDRFQIQGARREQLLHWATGRDLLQLVRVPQLWSMALELDQTTDLAAIASETDLYRTFVDQLVEKHINADDRKLAAALLGLMGLACLSSKTVPREQVLSWLESYQQHRRGDPNHYRGLLNDFPRLLHPVQTEDQQTLAFVHANLAIYLGATQLHKLYHLWDQIPLNDEGLGLRLFLLELSCHGPQAKEDAQARAVAHLSTVIDHLLRRGRMAELAVWLVRFGEHLLCHGIAHLKARQKEINGSDLKLLRACLRRRDPQLVQLLSRDLKGKARRQAMGLETQSKRNRDKEQRAQQKKLAERQRERLTMDARLWEELRNSRDGRRRVALVDALALEGKPGTAAQLKPYLTSPDKYLRGAVTRALGLLGEIAHAEVLVKRLQDQDPIVISEAIMALGLLGHAPALPQLKAFLDAENDFHRSAAAKTLGLLGQVAAVPALVARLEAGEPDHAVRGTIAKSLGQLGDPTAGPALIACLDQNRETAEDVRGAAANALGLLAHTDALQPLIACLQQDNPPDVRGSAANALGLLAHTDALQPLIACLQQDKDSANRGAAANALGLLAHTDALQPLIACLHRDNPSNVRASAANALGLIGLHQEVGSELFKRIQQLLAEHRDQDADARGAVDKARQRLEQVRQTGAADGEGTLLKLALARFYAQASMQIKRNLKEMLEEAVKFLGMTHQGSARSLLEKDYQRVLWAILLSAGKQAVIEANVAEGERTDIILEGEAIIELKLSNNGSLNDQLKQVRRYRQSKPTHAGFLVRIDQSEAHSGDSLVQVTEGEIPIFDLKLSRRPPHTKERASG